jgi:penicillin-binding protein 1B
MKKTTHLLWKLLLTIAVIGALALIYLDALVSTTFSDRKWEVPARVYARALELYPGLYLDVGQLEAELDLLGYRTVSRLTAVGQKQRSGKTLSFYSRPFKFSDEAVSARRVSLRFDGGRLLSIRSGSEDLPLLRLEPVQIGGIYPRHREDRLLLQLTQLPNIMVAGLLAVEDRKFNQHWGISPTGIARAALANYQAGKVVQGGSTLTQQLVKNYYLTRERSLWRKLTEVVMALLLELHFDKNEILEAYFNEVFLGQDGPRAIHGFGLAAQHYFNSSPEELGIHQQALLIGMVKGPSLYNPLRHPQRAIKRRNTVLTIMEQQGVINEAAAVVARAMPLGLSQRPRIMNSYPAFLDLVRRQLRRDYRQEDLGSLGLSIFTSFDPLLQRQAEQSIETILDTLDPDGQLQTAMVVTSFDNGEVKALIGGRSARFAGFNRALDAIRPVGSLIKPVVYLAALEQSRRWTLATPLDDGPLTVNQTGQPDWEPRNFDRKSHGQVLLHEALAKSYNQATARLGMELGVDVVQTKLRELGVERAQPAVPSMLLGAGGVSPLDIARLYQTIAAGGFKMPLHTIRDIVDANGQVLQRYPLHYDRVASLQSMHLLHYVLREVVEEGTGRGASRYLPENFAVAGKTGTTNDNRDSWFAGFSGDLLAVNWIGMDDNSATGLTGSGGALKIWAHFMAAASHTPLAYRVPDGIEHYWVDEKSGALSERYCEGARLMPFITGSEPRERAACTKTNNRIIEWFRELF